MKRKTLVFFIGLLLLINLYSCRDKNEQTDYNQNYNTAKEIPKAERLFFDVFKYVYKISYDTTLLNGGQIIKDGGVARYFEFPERKYFVSYGDFFKKCPDNLIRKGHYNVFLSDNFLTPASSARIEFIDYYVQQYKFNGQLSITNLGMNNSGGYSFEVKIDTGLLTNKYDTLHIQYTHWNSENTIHSFSDDSTANLGLMGTCIGITPNGVSFTTVVTDTLIRDYNCVWFVSGDQSLSTATLDVKSGSIEYSTSDSCSSRVDFYFDGIKFYDDVKLN